ncbi:hypothetical protein MPER_08968, partial [Moniliophthora perniciosa FA553]
LNYVLALKGDGRCGHYLCVNATIHDNTIIYQLTPLRTPVGWVALGFGRKMEDSHMVVLWENDDGSTTISQRFATGHTMPERVEKPPRIAWFPDNKPLSWHQNATSFSFEIQRDYGQIRNSSEPYYRNFIWAYSKYRPDSPDPATKIYQHYAAGQVTLDFNKELIHVEETNEFDIPSTSPVIDSANAADAPRLEPYTVHELIVIGHGTLVTVGFLWFKIHHISNFYVGLPVILIGWILGPLAVFDAQASHFLDAHQICGLLLFGLYVLQILLGRYVHACNRLPGRTGHPPSNILHACLGLAVIALAFLQVRSGMNEWETVTGRPGVGHWSHILLKTWAVVLPATYFIGLFLLRRQFYQERQGLGPSSTYYIALSPEGSHNSVASHTVFDVDDMEENEYGDIVNSKEADTESPLLRKH